MRRRWLAGAAILGIAVISVAVKTFCDITPVDAGQLTEEAASEHFQILDRSGVPLAVSYKNGLNNADILPLYAIPPLLQTAFITAEDRHFYSHRGVDWPARARAVWQNLRALHSVRGASTITEQVVRILHPRTRTLWSRWIEGFEASALERQVSKAQILEFYLNQVPFAAERRGVEQAARYYFNRDVTTLTLKETLALAVLPRAPSAYDLYRHPDKITPAILRLGKTMGLPAAQLAELERQRYALSKSQLALEAPHFIDYIRTLAGSHSGRLRTTLDAHLQLEAQTVLTERLRGLKAKQVHNAALLIADHTTGEILAWAVAGVDAQAIDSVLTPRQPGSSMKPFLYALALDSGWTPATILDDAPVSETINSGLHRFNNYSHSFYGKVSLREALGNSLNIPAIHTIVYVGVAPYLGILHHLGFTSLNQSADFYNEGLALGDGEVSLLELVQAYAALAHQGIYTPFTAEMDAQPARSERVYSEEAASLIGNILSDPWARQLEFGLGSILNMPTQTAVKTGTSTDYHDAWAVGYNSRYVAGVWMGNLDGQAMDGVTGSTGPALALHSVFSTLAQDASLTPLYLSPKLVKRDICLQTQATKGGCSKRTEYFMPGSIMATASAKEELRPALLRPADGLLMAYDPRLPAQAQAFEFVAQGIHPGQKVGWALNDELVATTDSDRYLWPLARGDYRLTLKVGTEDGTLRPVDSVQFHVK